MPAVRCSSFLRWLLLDSDVSENRKDELAESFHDRFRVHLSTIVGFAAEPLNSDDLSQIRRSDLNLGAVGRRRPVNEPDGSHHVTIPMFC